MSFRLAYPQGIHVPRVVKNPLAAAQTFNFGALLLEDGSGNWAECGANPTSIGGVALSGAGADTSGFNRFARVEFPPNYMEAMSVVNQVPFACLYMGTLPAQAGATYGVTRDTDSNWKVDFTKNAANQRVTLLDITWTGAPESQKYVVVAVLPANAQVV